MFPAVRPRRRVRRTWLAAACPVRTVWPARVAGRSPARIRLKMRGPKVGLGTDPGPTWPRTVGAVDPRAAQGPGPGGRDESGTGRRLAGGPADHMLMLCPVKKSCRRAPLTPTKAPTPPAPMSLPKMKLPPLPTEEQRIRAGVQPTLVWPKWTVYFVFTVF